jgi:hypothetical protein
MKQSTVLSYMDIFLYLGILFLCCIPIIFLIKKENKINPADAMIKTIKKLHRSFLYSLWKKLPSKHQMITC